MYSWQKHFYKDLSVKKNHH